MKVVRSLTEYAAPVDPVATIGNFDGQHRGHQALLRTVVETAKRRAGTPVVITFDPHPIRILAPHVPLRFLTSPEDKLAAFESAGIREVVFLPFTPTFAALSPESFVADTLSGTLRLREIFVGEHFAFGKGRAGRFDDLRRLCEARGIVVHAITPVCVDGAIVSSTRIRRLLQDGGIEEATRCLGRRYAWTGRVVEGEGRGRELGWPTANLPVPMERVVPKDGVYAASATWQHKTFDSIAYLGTRPTFEADGTRFLEVHLLDERQKLYGEVITVEFVAHLRDDRTFPSAEALAAQIETDVAAARTRLSALGHPSQA